MGLLMPQAGPEEDPKDVLLPGCPSTSPSAAQLHGTEEIWGFDRAKREISASTEVGGGIFLFGETQTGF